VDSGAQRGTASLQNGLYAHRAQADRVSCARPGSKLLLPLPRLFGICLEGADDPTNARAERICSAAEKVDTSSDGSGAQARANAFSHTPSTSITYPLSPPEAKPSMKRRWRIKNNTITGKIMNRPAALVSPQSRLNWL
jgi:hypothetical protein